MNFISRSFVIFIALVSSALANSNLTYEGVHTKEIVRQSVNDKLHKAANKLKAVHALSKKSVSVLKVSLSKSLKKSIQSRLHKKQEVNGYASTFIKSSSLPAHMQLAMNQVPVLDQGAHGSCATFAVIGAIDALRGQGDYYSQLCSLNLGKTLAQNGYSLSGWEGQDPAVIFSRIQEFGLVSIQKQREVGCGGLTDYPTLKEDESSATSLEDFHTISTPSYYSGLSLTNSILDISQWINKDISSDVLITKVKKSLYLGNRLVIGTLLPMTDDLGASAQYHTNNDTWVLTGALEQAINMIFLERSDWGGHAMIITGYDDNAVVMDNEGNPHKGLFTLRNSWGSDAGDNGDYYMTYDYLAVLAMQLTEVVNISNK